MSSILITGSNRGIGLELARQYAQQGEAQVFATCRTPASADALNQLAAQHPGRVHVIALDAADPDSIAESVRLVSAHTGHLDVLVNNAAINPRQDSVRSFGQLEAGPVLVTQAYAGLLRKGRNARVVNISSGAGSLERQSSGCGYTYHASKAALNMFSRCLAGTFRSDRVIVIVLNPGWVRTDMGGSDARLDASESVRGIIRVVEGLTMEDSGQFLQWDGQRLPW